jgi:hypothetical protein
MAGDARDAAATGMSTNTIPGVALVTGRDSQPCSPRAIRGTSTEKQRPAIVAGRVNKAGLSIMSIQPATQGSNAGTKANGHTPHLPATVAEWLRLFVAPDDVAELRALHVQQRYGRAQTVAGFYDGKHLVVRPTVSPR